MTDNPAIPVLRAALLGCALASLAGCGEDVSRAFGFTRSTPNEFTVTTRAPLVMPPDEAMPKPVPGAPRPQEQSPRTQALEAIAPDMALQSTQNDAAGSGAGTSAGQAALIDSAAAASARPARNELRGGTGVVGGLMFWKNRPSEILIDADAENRRLRADAANGDAPTNGPTQARAPD